VTTARLNAAPAAAASVTLRPALPSLLLLLLLVAVMTTMLRRH